MSAPVAESESAAARTLGSMNAGVHAERRAGGDGQREGSIATDEPDSVAQDGITGAGGFRHRGKEEEIRSWAERWKDKWASRKQEPAARAARW